MKLIVYSLCTKYIIQRKNILYNNIFCIICFIFYIVYIFYIYLNKSSIICFSDIPYQLKRIVSPHDIDSIKCKNILCNNIFLHNMFLLILFKVFINLAFAFSYSLSHCLLISLLYPFHPLML